MLSLTLSLVTRDGVRWVLLKSPWLIIIKSLIFYGQKILKEQDDEMPKKYLKRMKIMQFFLSVKINRYYSWSYDTYGDQNTPRPLDYATTNKSNDPKTLNYAMTEGTKVLKISLWPDITKNRNHDLILQ